MTGIYAENGPSPAPAADRGGTGVPEGRPRGTVVPRGWLPKIPPYGHLRVTPTVNADSYHLRRTSLKTTGPHTARRTRTDRPLPCQGQLPAGVGDGRDGTRLTNNVELEPHRPCCG